MPHTAERWSRNIKPAHKYPIIFAGRNTHVAQVCSQGLSESEPAAIYMNGLGADLAEQASKPGDWLRLAEAVSAAESAVDAHEAAFQRMQSDTKRSLENV